MTDLTSITTSIRDNLREFAGLHTILGVLGIWLVLLGSGLLGGEFTTPATPTVVVEAALKAAGFSTPGWLDATRQFAVSHQSLVGSVGQALALVGVLGCVIHRDPVATRAPATFWIGMALLVETGTSSWWAIVAVLGAVCLAAVTVRLQPTWAGPEMAFVSLLMLVMAPLIVVAWLVGRPAAPSAQQ